MYDVQAVLSSIHCKKRAKKTPYRASTVFFSLGLGWSSNTKLRRNFGEQEKSALVLARFSRRGCSRLPPRQTRSGLGVGFAYYMEGRRQGLKGKPSKIWVPLKYSIVLNTVFRTPAY